MSITDIGKIDFISIQDLNCVVLTISDHLDWEDEYSHLMLLQDKLNSYLRFIESGEIYDSYPDAKDKKIVIQIVKKYSITAKGEEFIRSAKKNIRDAGFDLISTFLEKQ